MTDLDTERQLQEINGKVEAAGQFVPALREEIGMVVVGQRRLVDRVLMALLADGHILLEGVPGLAKTLLVRTVSDAIQTHFSRIQFTPDLLPADVVGTQIYNQDTHEFTTRHGPIFANLVLADEINRAPAKVQSALLEAMQERQVTIGDETFKLPELFLVMATQNPIEQEGTYPLPEAQVDRFMMKVVVGYPSEEEELDIINRMTRSFKPSAQPVIDAQVILDARDVVSQIIVTEQLKRYVLKLVRCTRDPRAAGLDELADQIAFGASPRASIYMIQAARAHAFLDGRGYVLPDDIKSIAPDVLRHRIVTTYEAEAEEITADMLVGRILQAVKVP